MIEQINSIIEQATHVRVKHMEKDNQNQTILNGLLTGLVQPWPISCKDSLKFNKSVNGSERSFRHSLLLFTFKIWILDSYTIKLVTIPFLNQ